jgi:hypothetical protein
MTEQLALDAPQDKAQAAGPVECLGMTFENDEKRREYFLEKLREKLQDPEFRQIDGFPIGAEEDILAMSDPPYKPAQPESQEGFIPGLEPKVAPIPQGKKFKTIRMEAVRTGFRYCWQNRDYRTLIAVARRIPENILQEDQKLLMWYDQALTRSGEEA